MCITKQLTALKKPFVGSWRGIGRYQRAAKLCMADSEHPYKHFDDDPGFAG